MFRMLDVLPKIPQWKRVVLLATLFGCRAVVALPTQTEAPTDVSLRCERVLHVGIGDHGESRDICSFHDVEGRQCYMLFRGASIEYGEATGIWCDTAAAVTEI